MEDKQIIIHGVDVSRCMFFNKEYNEDDVKIKNFCEWQFVPCQEIDCAKCYFKNWKRKEQECERLKEALKEKTDEYNKLTINYDAYVSMANKKLDKLKQTLAEIKELIRKAVTPEETKTDSESLDCLYEALEKCEVIDGI